MNYSALPPVGNTGNGKTERSLWLKTAEAAALIGLSRSWLKGRRKQGVLIQGIHWDYTSPAQRNILYHRELLEHFMATLGNPELHLQKITSYLRSINRK